MKLKRILSLALAGAMVLSGQTLTLAAESGLLGDTADAVNALLSVISLSGEVSAAPQADNERQILNFNSNWKYIEPDDPDAASQDYDESDAEEVSLPHSRENWDLYAASTDEIQDINWYRRHFTLDKADAGDRVFVEFDGGGQINDVYVNGRFVGTAKGHFTHFSFDITDYVTFNEDGQDYDNVIAVRVDSHYYSGADGTPGTLPPGSGHDFAMFGGLHGDARLVLTDRAYIDSVFYSNDDVTYSDPQAIVTGEIEVKNTYGSDQEFTVISELLDANKAPVQTGEQSVQLGMGETKTVKIPLAVDDPHLWSVDDPYLYTARTTIKAGEYTLDSEERAIGIRTMKATAWNDSAVSAENPSGFWLNGERIEIQGTSMHMQSPYLGNARTDKMSAKDAHLLKDVLGVNMVRTSHYQHNPAFFDECDKIGLLVQEEAMGWGQTPDWEGQFVRSVKEMVKRDRNHPSIVMWSIVGNETNKDFPSAEKRAWLNAEVKALDPSRLTAQEEHTASQVVTDVFAWHDYNRSNSGIKVPGNGAKAWFVTEWNHDAGRNFLMAGDSEVRKTRQLLNYSRQLERFVNDPRVMGNLYWTSTCYITKNQPYEKGKVMSNLRMGGALGPMRDELDMRWWAYNLRAQSGNKGVAPVLKIFTEWKNDSIRVTSAPASEYEVYDNALYPNPLPGENTIMVGSSYDAVELYYQDGDGAAQLVQRLDAPNRNPGMVNGMFEFTVDPARFPWTADSRLIAKGYYAGSSEAAQTEIQFASSILVEEDGAQLKLHDTVTPDYGAIEADGSEAAWVVAELVDKNGQREYYGDENITVKNTTPGGEGEVFFGGEKLQMNDGLAGFWVRPDLDQTQEMSAEVEVDLGKVLDDGNANFNYQGIGWHVVDNRIDSYGGSYHESSTAGDKVIITFTGTQMALYGEYNNSETTNNSITPADNARVTLDGQDMGEITFISKQKYGVLANQRVYMTPVLENGSHTLTIEVLKSKKDSDTVRIDRVKVFDGVADLSESITVPVTAWTDARVALPAPGALPAPEPQMTEAALRLIIAQAKRAADRLVYTAASVDALEAAISEAEAVADAPASTSEDYEEQAVKLQEAMLALELLPEDYTRDGLAKLIAEAESMGLGAYRAASILELEDAIAAAKTALDAADPTAEGYKAAYDALKTVMDGMKRVADQKLKEIDHAADRAEASGQTGTVYYWSQNKDVWVNQNEGAALGLYTYSAKKPRLPGDYYEITFEGSQLELYTIRKSNHGLAEISIDGAAPEKVDFWMDLPDGSNTTDINLAWRSPILADGVHTVKVTFLNEKSPLNTANENTVVSLARAEAYGADPAVLAVESAKLDLLNTLNEARGIDQSLYSPETVETLKNAVKEAEDAIRAEDADQQRVEAADTALRAAVDGLQANPGLRTSLEQLVAKAKACNENAYTTSSFRALQRALEKAEALLAKPDASAQEIQSMQAELQAAVDALVLMPVEVVKKISYTDETKTEGEVDKVFFFAANGESWALRNETRFTQPLAKAPPADPADSAYYSMTFTGAEQIRLYATGMKNMGQGAISIDGGGEILVDFNYGAATSDNAASPTLIWSSGTLDPNAQHTIKVRRTYVATGDSSNENPRSGIGLGYFELCKFQPSDVEQAKSALKAKLEEAYAIDRGLYTPESLAILDSAIAMSESVLDSGTADTEEVNGALLNTLTPALDGLVLIGGERPYEKLQTLIAEAEGRLEADYTPESWAVFAQALAEAKNILPDAGEEACSTAYDNLKAAMDMLAPASPAEKTYEELQTQIAEQEGKIETDYTPESWAAFAQALAAARKIAMDAQPSVITEAYNALKAAADALVKIGVEPTPEPTSDPEPVPTQKPQEPAFDPAYADQVYWQNIGLDVTLAADGAAVEASMTGRFTDKVHVDVFKALAGRNVTLVIHTAGGDLRFNGRGALPDLSIPLFTVAELGALAAPAATPQPTPAATSEPAPEATSEPAPTATPEPAPEATPKASEAPKESQPEAGSEPTQPAQGSADGSGTGLLIGLAAAAAVIAAVIVLVLKKRGRQG